MARRSVRVDGRAIEQARIAKGWEQQHLARRARVSQASVSRMESGAHDAFAIETVEKIARALGVEIAGLTVADAPANAVSLLREARALIEEAERATEGAVDVVPTDAGYAIKFSGRLLDDDPATWPEGFRDFLRRRLAD